MSPRGKECVGQAAFHMGICLSIAVSRLHIPPLNGAVYQLSQRSKRSHLLSCQRGYETVKPNMLSIPTLSNIACSNYLLPCSAMSSPCAA